MKYIRCPTVLDAIASTPGQSGRPLMKQETGCRCISRASATRGPKVTRMLRAVEGDGASEREGGEAVDLYLAEAKWPIEVVSAIFFVANQEAIGCLPNGVLTRVGEHGLLL